MVIRERTALPESVKVCLDRGCGEREGSPVMGCCSMTQRQSGIDEVGPDEIELLELSADNLGIWSLGETRLQQSVTNEKDQPSPHYPSVRHLEHEVVLWGRCKEDWHHRIYSQPIRDWEGQPAHTYGEIVHSSLVSLYNSNTQVMTEHYLVLFSFYLLILSLDHSQHDFVYEGILPLSGLTFQAISLDPDTSHSFTFEISGPMVDSKIFMCASEAELRKWMEHVEERTYRSTTQPLSPSHCALSYLLPCDESWKREELKKYLLQAPICRWEGSPIQHMGQPEYLSFVYIINTQRQGLQERLLVLFPQDVLLLYVDNERLAVTYQGRLPRTSINAVEKSALPGRLEFELRGDLMEPLQVFCTCPEDYQNWIFRLQQLEKSIQATSNPTAPPLMPKKQRSRKSSTNHHSS